MCIHRATVVVRLQFPDPSPVPRDSLCCGMKNGQDPLLLSAVMEADSPCSIYCFVPQESTQAHACTCTVHSLLSWPRLPKPPSKGKGQRVGASQPGCVCAAQEMCL